MWETIENSPFPWDLSLASLFFSSPLCRGLTVRAGLPEFSALSLQLRKPTCLHQALLGFLLPMLQPDGSKRGAILELNSFVSCLSEIVKLECIFTVF